MKPAIRISFGIVALTTTLLLAADWMLELFPDPHAPILEARKDLSESLAIQYSSLVTADRLPDMQPAMEAIVAQMPDVLSMSLQNFKGEALAATREHATLWKAKNAEQSTPTHVLIPIFQSEKPWAVLQVRFDALPYSGLLGLLRTPLYKLTAVMAGLGFIAYLLYLSRTLRYLDPSSVVPSRVRAALNQLVEGVFILDQNKRIVLANSSFAKQVGLTPEALIGVDPASLPWVKNNTHSGTSELPWVSAIAEGIRKTDERLELLSPTLGKRVLTANVSPIIDGAGKGRGVLVSFDDKSEIERVNEGLIDTLKNLESANAEIRHKNKELHRLANIDPLTECFNRRALFEKFEIEFALAVRDGLKLSVVMADIDHFKTINDEFGHAVGDIVIKDMAQILTASAGVNDVVGRYGGEEFCMLLIGADFEEAKRLSEKCRAAFSKLYQASTSSTKGRQITASFGFSSLEFGAKDVAEILNQADLALYASKNNGRNQVTAWTGSDTNQRKAS